ncbi:hypothetical protein [Campylobacter rectus]|nr:hypothetical protein [Campylobacter rectus]
MFGYVLGSYLCAREWLPMVNLAGYSEIKTGCRGFGIDGRLVGFCGIEI